MTHEDHIKAFLARDFPQFNGEVLNASPGLSRIRIDIGDAHLRPGGTVSGPTLMAAADAALYVAVLAAVGIIPLAVTTNLNINFLRKPAADCAVIAEARPLKVGKSLFYGEVSLYSEGFEQPVAHATGTYSIPPRSDTGS